MTSAHSDVSGLSFPRLRPLLFLVAHFLLSDGYFLPGVSPVPSAVLSSWVYPYLLAVGPDVGIVLPRTVSLPKSIKSSVEPIM